MERIIFQFPYVLIQRFKITLFLFKFNQLHQYHAKNIQISSPEKTISLINPLIIYYIVNYITPN
jgi:hypothetical protein